MNHKYMLFIENPKSYNEDEKRDEQMKKENYLKYGLMDGLFYAWNACFTGFITSYFLKCGLEASSLSTALAVYMFTCFGGAIFWGRVCDRKKTNRKVFLMNFALVIGLASFITFLTEINVLAAVGLYICLGFLLSSLGSNLDAWMLRSFQKDASLYGKARAIGSLGYSLCALVAGIVIRQYGYGMIQLMQLATGICTLAMAFVLKELPFEESDSKVESGDTSLLLKSPLYVILIVLLFLGGLAAAPVNNMKTVFIQNTGGDVSMLGLDSFIGVTLQAVLIFVSGKFTRIPVKVRLLIMSSMLLGDMVLVYSATTPVMIMAGSIFWNVSFSVMLPTQREIVEKYVDASVRNIAHNIADAAYNNFAAIIALSYSGILINNYGVKMIALTGAFIMVAAVIIEIILLVKPEKNTLILKEETM